MEKVENTSLLRNILVGTCAALGASMVLVLVFAFCLRFFGMSDGVITIVVQIIKGLSVLFGTFIALKKQKELGIWTGVLIGAMFTALSFLVFSVLDGFRFEFSSTILIDLVFGSIIGGISGIIAVNLKK